MKIAHLLTDVSEMASRVPKKSTAPVGPTETPPNLSVVQGGKSATADMPAPGTLTTGGSVGAAAAARRAELEKEREAQAAKDAVSQAYRSSTDTSRSAAWKAPAQEPAGTTSQAPAGSTQAATAPTAPTAPAGTTNDLQKLAGIQQPSKFGQALQAVKSGGQALGRGAVSATKAIGKATPGVLGTLGDIGASAVRGVGNIASQATGAVGQALAAPVGGAIHGYKTARSGSTFSQPSSVKQPISQQSGQEIDDLKSLIQRLDQRLTAAGIKENNRSK